MRLENLFRRVNDPEYVYGSDIINTDVYGLPYIKPSKKSLQPIPFNTKHPGHGVMFHSMDSLGGKNITHEEVQFVIHDGFVAQRQYATFSRYPFFWHGSDANALLICKTHLMTSREYLQKHELHYTRWAESVIALPVQTIKTEHSHWYNMQISKFGSEERIQMCQYVPTNHFLGYLFFENEIDAEHYDRTAKIVSTKYKNGLITEKQAIALFLQHMRKIVVYRIDGTVMSTDEKELTLTSYICACLESQLLESAFDQTVEPEHVARIRPDHLWTVTFQQAVLQELNQEVIH